jgi:hypothetical protein
MSAEPKEIQPMFPNDLHVLIPLIIDEREREIRANVRSRNMLKRTPGDDRPHTIRRPSPERR